jgi:hypothetical protein
METCAARPRAAHSRSMQLLVCVESIRSMERLCVNSDDLATKKQYRMLAGGGLVTIETVCTHLACSLTASAGREPPGTQAHEEEALTLLDNVMWNLFLRERKEVER